MRIEKPAFSAWVTLPTGQYGFKFWILVVSNVSHYCRFIKIKKMQCSIADESAVKKLERLRLLYKCIPLVFYLLSVQQQAYHHQQ